MSVKAFRFTAVYGIAILRENRSAFFNYAKQACRKRVISPLPTGTFIADSAYGYETNAKEGGNDNG
jgi:hypothetical protein